MLHAAGRTMYQEFPAGPHSKNLMAKIPQASFNNQTNIFPKRRWSPQ